MVEPAMTFENWAACNRYLWDRLQSIEIDLLAGRSRRIETAGNSCGVIADSLNLILRLQYNSGEHLEIKPFVLGVFLEKPIVQIETVNVDICSHEVSEKQKPS